MKYAVFAPTDQTITYYKALPKQKRDWTTSHKEATLFLEREKAQKVVDAEVARCLRRLKRMSKDPAIEPYVRAYYAKCLTDEVWKTSAVVEEVEDENEFRSREDTW